MKILEIIPTLGTGGAEHFVVDLALEFNNMGVNCDVTTLFNDTDSNDLVTLLKSRDIKVTPLNKKDGFDFSVFFKIIKLIRKEQYDVVHAHVGAIKYISLASFVLPKVKFFATLHSEARREAGKSFDLLARKLMFKMKRCLPITISPESESSFELFYGFKTLTILNGVSNYTKKNIINLRDNEEQIVFVHPASCQPVKNQELLLKAFDRLTKKYPNTKLVWVGNNSVYKQLFNSLIPLMGANVKCLGVVSNVRDYLSQADAMCLSSKMEGMPMTIIEAFSVGCIPICTPVGGCKDIIEDGKNGFLSNDLSIDSYYNVLECFCNLTEEERNRLKKESFCSFSKYTISNCASKYLETFKGSVFLQRVSQ